RSSAGRGASACGEEASSSPPVESSGTYHSPVAGQTQASVPSAAGVSFCPERPTQARRRAGTPATRACGGTSWTTVAPAATIAQAPIVTGATQTARAPMDAPVSQVTPTASQSEADFGVRSGETARGKWSLVNTAAGPTKTPSASSAGSYTRA